MTPESIEARVGRLERSQDVLASRVAEFAKEIDRIVPLTIAVTKAQGEITGLRGDVHRLEEKFDERDRQSAGERKSIRSALIALTASIAAALITAIGVIVSSGHV